MLPLGHGSCSHVTLSCRLRKGAGLGRVHLLVGWPLHIDMEHDIALFCPQHAPHAHPILWPSVVIPLSLCFCLVFETHESSSFLSCSLRSLLHFRVNFARPSKRHSMCEKVMLWSATLLDIPNTVGSDLLQWRLPTAHYCSSDLCASSLRKASNDSHSLVTFLSFKCFTVLWNTDIITLLTKQCHHLDSWPGLTSCYQKTIHRF